MSQTRVLTAVSIGGAIGALGRWALAEALPHSGTAFPWATLLTNVTGCLLMGILMGLMPPGPLTRPFLGTGVLGGFTTFSTFAVETRTLAAGHAWASACLYAAGSVALGLAAVQVGLAGARRRRGVAG
ncbi:fluoride efflux transporter FluC [Embleya scabrispora]|uniref:fluoride efflux transporter FluC n=1 Tax=Embleya scabrispora TaxID=159449 RepID=UPI00037AD344|nr:CrcB family protein [Embleya scabrispora]MYS79538.1 fluoride efflux transporter CrcB [Streptomyces sp. SID5474]